MKKNHLKELAFHGDEFFNFSSYIIQIFDHRQSIIHTHWHDEMEFMYVEKGPVLLYFSEKKYVITDKTLIFLPSGSIHSVGNFGKGLKKIYSFVFDSDLIQLKNHEMSIFNNPNIGVFNKVAIDSEEMMVVEKTVHQIIDSYTPNNQSYTGLEFLIRGNLFILFHYLFHYSDTQFPKKLVNEQQVNYKKVIVEKYIKNNCSDKLSLKVMSGLLHVSPEHFSREFKHQFNINYSTYLLDIRLSKAKNLLKTTKISMIDTSLACGFTSTSYFSNKFKNKIGLTPTEYRRKYGY